MAWTKLGDAAMAIVERLEGGREREAPGQVGRIEHRDGGTRPCARADVAPGLPAGHGPNRDGRAKRDGAAGTAPQDGMPAAPIAASLGDRNG